MVNVIRSVRRVGVLGAAAAILAAGMGAGSSPVSIAPPAAAGDETRSPRRPLSAAQRQMMLAQLAAQEVARDAAGNPLASACFVPDPTEEQFEYIMNRWQAMPPTMVNGGVVDRYFTANNVWSGAGLIASSGQAAAITLTYSFPDDGVTWGDGSNGPVAPNDLNAQLVSVFGAGNLDRGREYIRQGLASWRRRAGITYIELADDNTAYSTTYSHVATRGDTRIGANSFGLNGVLAYNYFPGASDMTFNSSYFPPAQGAFGDPANNYRYFRNVTAHEHGHGLGFVHPTPCNATKLMEPFISVAYDGTQLDETRGSTRNYGDRFAGNNQGSSARDFGTLTGPTRSIIEENMSTNGSTGPNNTDEDWYRFTLGSTQTVTIVATPTGGSYQNGSQTGGCNPTNPGTINAGAAGNHTIELRNGANGATVLQTANTAAAGTAETLNAGSRVAGTYWVRVVDPAATSNQFVQTYTLTIRVGTSNAPPTAIAGLNKRVQAGTTAYFMGNVNSYANETGASISAYAWDLDGDGTFEAAGATPTRGYVSNGTYAATLRVTDSNGLTATDTINVVVFGATTSVTGIVPLTGNTGQTVPVTINGANFKNVTAASMVTVSGTGVTASGTPVSNITGTQLTGLSFVINSGATLGARNVTVSNTDGTGVGNGVFTVNSGVCVPATIGTQPTAQTGCVGGTATLTVVGSGSSPFTYQWRRSGVNVGGATGSTLVFNPLALANAGSYDVIVTNACGNQTSNSVNLTVNSPVNITTQPADLNRCPGTSAAFTVAATGTPAPTFQWRRNAVNITGATSSTFTIASVVAGDAATYDAVATNSCGSQTSAPATLTVSSGVSITTQPISQTVCEGEPVFLAVVASGGGPFTYQWRLNGSDISAFGSTYTISSAETSNAGSYTVVVTGGCGSITSNAAIVTVRTYPGVTTQPLSISRCTGAAASFTVGSSGSPAPTFQWRKNSVNIAGATSATFNIASVAAADAASYDVVLTNICGTATSSAAILTVSDSPTITGQPASITRCTGTAASFTVVASGSPPLSYQWRRNSTNIAGATSATFNIASVVTGDAASYDVVVTNSCSGSPTSNAAVLTVNSTPVITGNPGSLARCTGTSAAFAVVATGTPAPSFQWRKNSVNIAGATSASFNIGAVAAADAASYDVVVTNSCGSVTSTPAAILTINTSPAITTQPTAVSACVGGSAMFSVAASGTPAPTFQWRKNSVNIAGATASTYSIGTLVAGDAASYDVVVTNSCGSVTSNAAAITLGGGPSISQQPQPQSECTGDTATFTLTSTGADTFQWRKDGAALNDGATLSGSIVSGSATSSVTISGLAAGDAGNYDCVLTSSCGPITSDAAALTITAAVTITQQPADQTGCTGATASLTVAATGGTPVTYQWRKNGTPIPGETSATLAFASLAGSSAGTYDCVVTNSCGSVTSDDATVTVCVADFNCSGAVGVQDIFDFLAGYFGNDPRADINESGAIGVQDIFDFLALYFAGC